MLALQSSHPTVWQEFEAGHFSVQRHGNHGFASVACDQTIEQTINRDAKSAGGWVGFSTQRNAVNRWVASSHARGAITKQCEKMAGRCKQDQIQKETEPSQIAKNESSVKNLMECVSNRINPFTVGTGSLVNISSGMCVSEDVKEDMLNAYEKGGESAKAFEDERIFDKKKSVFHPISSLKLKTFKTPKLKSASTQMKSNSGRSAITQLLLMKEARPVQFEESMKFEMEDVPLSLADNKGKMRKTNKADLLHLIHEDIPELGQENVRVTADTVIFDGMAIIRSLKKTDIPDTFGKLSRMLFDDVISRAQTYRASRIDVVWDTYTSNQNIKNIEQERRADACGVQIFHLCNENQKVPKAFQQYLSSSENKQALIDFIFAQWETYTLPPDVKLMFGHQNTCHMMDETGTSVVQSLQCDHIEADTRMLLHAQHANTSTVIISHDTDVFMLCILCAHELTNTLILQFHSTLFNFDILKRNAVYTPEICQALVSLHCFTGCDSVSSFFRKGKKTAWQIFWRYPELRQLFAQVPKFQELSMKIFKKSTSD